MIYTFKQNTARPLGKRNELLLPSHGFFVPCSSIGVCVEQNVDMPVVGSDRVFYLNGVWKEATVDVGTTKLDDLTANFSMVKLPHVVTKPEEDFAYILTRTFSVFDPSKNYLLSFEKVYGTFEVYVNGNFCGSSEFGFGEFDITPCVQKGDNVLLLRIVPFDGTRTVGVDGDVLLTLKEEYGLVDYNVAVTTDGVTSEAVLMLAVTGENASVQVVFGDGDDIMDEPTCQVVNGLATVRIKRIVKSYTAETPELYEAFVRVFDGERETECSHLRFGFTETRTTGKRITIGEIPFTVKGVVYNVTPDSDFEDELRIIKSFNFNTVVVRGLQKRAFYKLCNEMGLFVINEFPLDAVTKPQEKPKKKKKKDVPVEEPAVRDYLRALTLEVFATIKSEPCVLAYSFNDTYDPAFVQNDIEELASRMNKPVENIDFAVSESGFEDGRMPNIAYVRAEYVRLDEFEEEFEKENLSGAIIDAFHDGVGKVGLFDENNLAKEGAVVAKYVFRPYTCELEDNRTLAIRNKYAFRRSDGLKAEVYAVNGSKQTAVATFHPVLQPGETQDYSIYLGEYDEKTRLLVRFEENGSHLATETVHLLDETVRPEDIAGLKTKKYEYTVKKVEFTLDKTEENTLPKRRYFVPFSAEECIRGGKAYEDAERSDRSFSLSGEWDFLYYKESAPVTFGGENTEWEKITLPASWESAGYEECKYSEGYPFKSDLRRFSVEETEEDKNSVGIYRKVLNIGDTAFRYVLYFAQVNGSMELHVNGQYVGFSQLGMAEFDVSDYLKIGENEIVVIVKRWTPVAYLYARSGFNASGIIGDVRLVKCRKGGLFDYSIDVKRYTGEYLLDADLAFFDDTEGTCRVELKKGNTTVYDKVLEKKEGKVSVRMQGDFIGYDENKPVLYDLYVKIVEKNFVTECVRIPVGFKTLNVVGDIVYYNDEPLKVRGITYNPTYNAYGELLSTEDVKRDLALIKEYGFNAVRPVVRTSPEFVHVAASYGLYVIGGGEICSNPEDVGEKEYNAVMKNGEFEGVVGQTVDMYTRRDGGACNMIGYLFNEDGDTVCGKEGVRKIKENTTLPVMNKGSSDVKVISFPSVNGVLDEVNRVVNVCPLFLSEYAPGTGVGCATVNEYQELMSGLTCCLGGCVDTFVDDAMKGKIGKTNGIFTVERYPYPGADSIRYLYRPLVSELSVETNTIEIINRTDAEVNDKYISLNVLVDGATVSRTRLSVTLQPQSAKRYDVFIGHIDGDMFLNVAYHSKKDDRLLYTEQHIIHEQPQSFRLKEGERPLRLTKLFDYVDITFDNGYVRFNKRTGSIVRYELGGVEILKADSIQKGGNSFVTNLYRPFVRNMENPPKFASKVKEFKVMHESDNAHVARLYISNLLYVNGKETFLVEDNYTVNANGVIEVNTALIPLNNTQMPLDCFGKQLRLNNTFGNVTYYGNGATDNYIDMCEHTTIGLFNLNVDKTFEGFPVLQEVGNRTNVRYALVRDNDGEGILLVAKRAPFQLRVSPYSDKEITDAYATGERPKQSGVYVDVNAFVGGIGTSEDGYPLPKYVVRAAKYSMEFSMIPVSAL